jgi:hypothetical protein
MTSTVTMGAVWSSLTTTFRPLGSLKYSTGTVNRDALCACARTGSKARLTLNTNFVTELLKKKKFQDAHADTLEL